MLNILSQTITLAGGVSSANRWDSPSHWPAARRFDNRRDAEIEAHLIARRRD